MCWLGVCKDLRAFSVCHQLGQVFVLQYVWGTAGSMDHHHVFKQAGLSWKVLFTVVILFWQTGQGGEWQVIWCLGNQQIIHDVGSLCISAMLFLNFFLPKKKNIEAWAEKVATGTKGNFTIMPSCTTRQSWISSSSLLFPSISSSLSSSSFFSSPSSSISPI